MKTTSYIKAIALLAVAGAMTACDENAWNDHLDGFEDANDQPTANQQRIDYTLTDADYAAIAANADNKALAGEDLAADLAALATTKRFSGKITAAEYVPAFLNSTAFPYFTLTDGSAINLTYNTTVNEPATVTEASKTQTYTVPNNEYENVWNSENFINGFAPSHPASEYLPAILKANVDPEKGKYVVVSYKNSATEPVFGGGTEEPAGPVEIFAESFTESLGEFTIEDDLLPAELTAVWTWGGANYGAKANAFKDGTSYATTSMLISPVIDLTGYTDCKLTFDHVYNKFPDLDFAIDNCTLNIREEGATNWTMLSIPTVSTNTSWDFVNAGEISLKDFEGKKVQLGFLYISEDGKSGTWEVKNLVLTGTAGAKKAPARAAADATTETLNAVYMYNGSAWTVPANFFVFNPADYTAMGQSHADLPKAEPFISIWLNQHFAFASEGDIKYVLWLCFANSKTSYRCSQYVFKESQWTLNDYVVAETNQFVKKGSSWFYDPSVTITLPAGKNQELSAKYFQACVDWVYENICVPLGDTSIKSGKFYVSSYGNNEYYSGTSAFQGNIDLRPDKAREQYPAGYQSMTDEQIVELEKKRFIEEVMPGALAKLHPDAKPVDGIDVLYTITFGVYTGSNSTETAVWKVTAPATFTPVSCTWDKK
ncbi:MAG: immune inhibitor A [Muribaculaceae bacterium]|nr:immune inhibitor A [Muribaculaceae bacterium]